MIPRLTTSLLALALAACAASAPARAEVVPWKAQLSGGQETPPTDSAGKGEVEASYDTESKKLSWTITYSGLSGPVTAAHFHGPALPGKTAPAMVPIANVTANPIKGEAILTTEQADALKRGVYVNLHTAKFPDGEIRGELK
ncbi:MAG: CHRD domain-containing protein [Alsobacter sp.]